MLYAEIFLLYIQTGKLLLSNCLPSKRTQNIRLVFANIVIYISKALQLGATRARPRIQIISKLLAEKDLNVIKHSMN
jgi:hypothetical protein